MFPLKLRDTANSDYKERKFSRGARGKNARETRGATNVRFFPLSTPTHVCITPGIIYMEMRIGIDFTSKPVTEPASGDRLSRHLTSIKFSSVENQKASEFPLPPPPPPPTCLQPPTSPSKLPRIANFSCVRRSSRRRNTRGFPPLIFSFFFSFFSVSSFFGTRKEAIVPRSKFSTGKTERREEGGWGFRRK